VNDNIFTAKTQSSQRFSVLKEKNSFYLGDLSASSGAGGENIKICSSSYK